MKHIAAFFDSDTGLFEVVTGTVLTFFGAFTAAVQFMQRDWWGAFIMLALAIFGYRWATTYIALRATRRAQKHQ